MAVRSARGPLTRGWLSAKARIAGPGQQTGVWERFSDVWCGCQAASRHPCRPHSDTREQQSQLLGAAQPRALPHLALQDEHLLAKGQDLAVAIITEQLGDQGSKGREQHEKQMPEHAGRMCALDGEVNIRAGRLERRGFGLSGPQRLVSGPHEIGFGAPRRRRP